MKKKTGGRKAAARGAANSASRSASYEWKGRPVFVCRLCRFERVDDLDAVLRHEARHQPTAKRERETK